MAKEKVRRVEQTSEKQTVGGGQGGALQKQQKDSWNLKRTTCRAKGGEGLAAIEPFLVTICVLFHGLCLSIIVSILQKGKGRPSNVRPGT